MTSKFSTRDFNTIVLLRYHGYKILEVTTEGKDGKAKRVWVEDSPDLQKLLVSYDNNEVDVKAKDWMRTIEDTKEFVHR